MGGPGGINIAGMNQIQKVSSAPIENVGKDEGQLGSHTVKVGESDASTTQVKNQIGDVLTSSTGAERAIANFLSQTEDLGRSIQEKLVAGGRANEVLSFKSLLSREINLRANEWIETMSNLAEGGTSVDDLDKMSHGVVDELKTMVDRAFKDTTNAMTESESVGKTPPLVEAQSYYRDRAATVLGTDPKKTHVYDNIGGGSCFFHAALQQLTKVDPDLFPVANTVDSANELRQALIDHTHDLKIRLDQGETLGMKADTTESKGQTLTHVFARTSEQTDIDSMYPISEGFNLAFDPTFAKYGKEADVSTAALLADYLQRPVTVIAQTGDGTSPDSVNKMEFHYGLGNGQKLSGDPLLIYYDQQKAHFMAVEVEK